MNIPLGTGSSNVLVVYTLAMAKYICVQIKDVQAPLKIEADSIEKGSVVYTLKKGNETVGELAAINVLGWWVEDTGDPGPP